MERNMNRIRIVTTVDGSEDGIHTKTYEAGQEYELGDSEGGKSLCDALVDAGLAELAVEEPASELSPEPEPDATEPEVAVKEPVKAGKKASK
jgi:hypothetical protein